MRIAFLWDWDIVPEQAMTWKDGLASAVKIISEHHDIRVFACSTRDFILPHEYFDIHVYQSGDNLVNAIKKFEPDVIWHWADLTRPHAKPLSELGIPMAISFAGGSTDGENLGLFNHFFVESEVYRERFEVLGRSVSTAFGTNTKLFAPDEHQAKTIDVLFPATYADWKRHNLLMDSCVGLKVCTAGWMYHDHEQWCWQYPQSKGALMLPHVSAEVLKYLYASSRVVVVPSRADGGSQRTVLEAMAMNIPVVVTSDSDKTCEYVQEGGGFISKPNSQNIREAIDLAMVKDNTNTRPYIEGKWSEIIYANSILCGLSYLTGKDTVI